MVKLFLKVRKRLLLALVVMLLIAPTVQVTAAAESSDGQTSSWFDKAKDRASQALEAAREKAPEVLEQTKDKAAKAYDAVKEAAPEVIDKAKDGLSEAQDKISDWNQDQQDQFWERVDGMASGSDQNEMPTSSQESTQSNTPVPNQAGITPSEDASAPEVEKGDGYVIVNGERYEAASEADESSSRPLILGVAFGSVCLVALVYSLHELAKREQK